MAQLKKQIFGWNIVKNGNTYVFGCGAVSFEKRQIQNFIREVKKRHKSITAQVPKDLTEQEQDFYEVVRQISRRDIHITDGRLQEAVNVFGNLDRPKAQVKKKAVKKAVKKK